MTVVNDEQLNASVREPAPMAAARMTVRLDREQAADPEPAARSNRGGPSRTDAQPLAEAQAVPDAQPQAVPDAQPQPLPVRELPASARKGVDGENFPVALRVLPRRLRESLLALYAYARYVDDLGDEFAGPRTAALATVADQVRLLYAGGQPELGVVAGLARLREEHGVPAAPFLDLVSANVTDQDAPRYRTFADLLDYCALSANPVGRVVLAILGRPQWYLAELSDRICSGLQIVEHLQDIGEDYRAGRIYLPAEDLTFFDVGEQELGAATASDGLRALVRFETDRALAYLNAGAPLVSALRGWGRLAIGGYLAGGRAAVRQIRLADYDVLGGLRRPGGRQIAAEYLRAQVRSPG